MGLMQSDRRSPVVAALEPAVGGVEYNAVTSLAGSGFVFSLRRTVIDESTTDDFTTEVIFDPDDDYHYLVFLNKYLYIDTYRLIHN